MRHNVLKKNSTKAERIVYEVLKSMHIPFKHRWKIDSREVDFIVGNLAIDIDGHEQDVEKNNLLIENGYTPIHIQNQELINNRDLTIKKLKLCLLESASMDLLTERQ